MFFLPEKKGDFPITKIYFNVTLWISLQVIFSYITGDHYTGA